MICLNMIVKDESKVIERSLNSLKQVIDYWVIVDTGSTDGTQELIKKTLKQIPGELHERPWVNFGHNRNESLSLAQGKGDYFLLIDADEILQFSEKFNCPVLDKDCYFVKTIDPEDSLEFSKICLISAAKEWKWEGVIHEYLICSSIAQGGLWENVVCIRDTSNSGRSQDPEKYKKDAQLLEEALKEDPNNSRYLFYLAQSYSNARDYLSALKCYEKRGKIREGCHQERMWSLLCIGKIQEHLQFPSETVIRSYCLAYQEYPTRAEPLFHLANYYMKQGNVFLAYLVSQHGVEIPHPNDPGYVEHLVYDYGISFLLANASLLLGKKEEAACIYQRLLLHPKLLSSHRVEISGQLAQIQRS